MNTDKAIEIGEATIYWEEDNGRAFPTIDPSVNDLLDPYLVSQHFKDGDKVRILIVKEKQL